MGHNHNHEQISGKRLAGTILLNLLITLAEFIAGIMSGYLALLADAVHNLSDVAALILAWLGIKGAQIPANKRSTYGYKRIEVMTALISAVALVVIALYILWEAYNRLLEPQPITHPVLFMSVAVLGLLGNLASVWLLFKEKSKSLNLKAAFLHMAFDAASSVAVIIGGIAIILTGEVMIDVILSAIIAITIFWSSYLVIKEAVLIFMESVPTGIDFDQVREAIESTQLVINVHDLHIWSLSSQEAALSCHVCLKAEDYADGPEVLNKINQLLKDKFQIGHATIQLEQEHCHRPTLLCSSDDYNHNA